METMGVSKVTLAGLLCVESVMLSLAGGVVGIGAVAAWLHAWPLTLGVEGWGIDIRPDNAIVVLGLGAAFIVGLLAAIGPAIDTMRRPLADAVKEA
jgi:ABC-type antimicrobial peptide transport system permease subunit